MNDVLVPSWIKDIRDEDDRRNALAESSAQEAIAASLQIQAEGPIIWHSFLKDLAIATDALASIGLNGTASASKGSEHEEHCRVQVIRTGLLPKQTFTDLFFQPGGKSIRCHTMEGEAFKFAFGVVEGKVSLYPSDKFEAVTTEKAAEIIVKRMVKIVRS